MRSSTRRCVNVLLRRSSHKSQSHCLQWKRIQQRQSQQNIVVYQRNSIIFHPVRYRSNLFRSTIDKMKKINRNSFSLKNELSSSLYNRLQNLSKLSPTSLLRSISFIQIQALYLRLLFSYIISHPFRSFYVVCCSFLAVFAALSVIFPTLPLSVTASILSYFGMEGVLLLSISSLTSSPSLSLRFSSLSVSYFKSSLFLNSVTLSRPPNPVTGASGFNLQIQEMKVDLSYLNLLQGKNIIKKIKVKGVRGVVEKVKRQNSDQVQKRVKVYAPKWGNWEISKVKVKDVLVLIRQELPPRESGGLYLTVEKFISGASGLRQNMFLYDLFNSTATGSYDYKLFSLKPNEDDPNIKTLSTTLNIDHISHSMTGPASWVTSGLVEVDVDVHLPQIEHRNTPFFKDRAKTTLSSLFSNEKTVLHSIQEENEQEEEQDFASDMKFRVKLKHVQVAVPWKEEGQVKVKNIMVLKPAVWWLEKDFELVEMNFEGRVDESQWRGAWYLDDISFWSIVSNGAGKELSRLGREYKERYNLWEKAKERVDRMKKEWTDWAEGVLSWLEREGGEMRDEVENV